MKMFVKKKPHWIKKIELLQQQKKYFFKQYKKLFVIVPEIPMVLPLRLCVWLTTQYMTGVATV